MAGLRIAYERAGHGPPLVLAHGIVGDARGTWGAQLEALSDESTVVAWDGSGTGRSADPPDGFRLPEFADCLAGFVAALELRHPHVAGLSFRGAMALELYRRHGHLFGDEPDAVAGRMNAARADWLCTEGGSASVRDLS